MKMLCHATLFALATLTFNSPTLVKGHGYLETPRSRNWFAHDVIQNHQEDCPTRPIGCPKPEYCQHCLNVNTGVCGKSPSRSYESIDWLDQTPNGDGQGSPMPWISQIGGNAADGPNAPYVEGRNITIDSYLDTHHNGHMEIRACVIDDGNATKCTHPSDFEGNELEFLEDRSNHDGYDSMPPDPAYPERGMYSGGQGGGIKDFSFEYRLPIGIYGEKILLQWKYITANSCSPPGYDKYFSENSYLPSDFWTAGLSVCTLPYPPDGDRALSTNPEQFFNCAEISILPGSAPSNVHTDPPTKNSPMTSQPTKIPTTQPTPPVTPAPMTSQLTKIPTNQPTPPVTPAPTPNPASGGSGGTVCCAERHTGYKCTDDVWCNANQSQCSICSGAWMSTPVVRTGCCSWGQDCSTINPMTNAGCHFLQSDCEGSCGGNWQLI